MIMRNACTAIEGDKRCSDARFGRNPLSRRGRHGRLYSLPNPGTLFGCDEHFIAWLHFECVIPGVDVSGWTVDPKPVEKLSC